MRVCQLIEQILPWDDYGIVISGIAYNGEEAFSLIQSVHPDIVITDIRMPGYDGLELIEKGRSIDPDISFIIVSGYRDFEYAQRALKFGAEDYLLKPVSKDELEQIVLRVIEKKTLKQEKHVLEDALQKELVQSREVLRDQFAAKIINNKCRIESSELAFLGDRFSILFQSPFFNVLIFQIDHSKSEQNVESTKAIDTILQKMELSVSSYLKDHTFEMLRGQVDFSLIYILNHKSSTGLSQRELDNLHELATQKISEYGQWRISLCVGKVVSDIELLHESYSEAEYARCDRILRGCGKILEKRSVPSVEEELRLFDFDELEEKLSKSIKAGESSELEALFLTSIVPPGFSRRIQNPYTVLELFNFAARLFISHVRNFSADEAAIQDLLSETEKVLSRSGSLERLSSQFSELYGNSLNNILSSKRVKDYKPIRVAKEYIDSHYSEPIDLNIVAREAGFNPVYFSSLFKKETGINFKEYLLQKRVESAKELLVSGNDTIMAISEKVGYKDVRYFSRIFSKSVGIKPNMYRRIYG